MSIACQVFSEPQIVSALAEQNPIRVSRTIRIQCPIATVFAYLTDVRRLSKWNTTILEAHPDNDGPLQVGSQYSTVGKLLMSGQVSYQTWQVIDYEYNRRMSVKSTSGLIPTFMQWTVEADGDTTQCSAEVHEQGGIMAWAEPLACRMARSQLAYDLMLLKEILEGREQ